MAKGIAQIVRELAEPLAEDFGFWLWDVEYVKEGGRRILRLTIDSEEGIGVDDCEKLHRAIDPVLDEVDPIEEAYYLEVCSPGIERELRTDIHRAACVGWDVEVRLYAPMNGAKAFRGELLEDGEDGTVRIRTESGEEMHFALSTVSKIKTVFDF